MGTIIKDVKRNNNEIIRIEISEFKGKELINIRIWYASIDANTGGIVYKPTQKGVALNISEYTELKDGIDRIGIYLKDSQSGEKPEQPKGSAAIIPDEPLLDEDTEKDDDMENDEEVSDNKKKS